SVGGVRITTGERERSSDALQVSTELNLSRFAGRTRVNWGVFARANWLSYALGEQFTNTGEQTSLVISSGAYVEAEVPLGATLRASPGLAVTAYPTLYPVSLEPRLRLTWQ